MAVIGNNLPEPNKTFFVNLFNVQNAALATNQAAGTILNDDHYPVIQSIVVAAGQVTLVMVLGLRQNLPRAIQQRPHVRLERSSRRCAGERLHVFQG